MRAYRLHYITAQWTSFSWCAIWFLDVYDVNGGANIERLTKLITSAMDDNCTQSGIYASLCLYSQTADSNANNDKKSSSI